jgi:hypothetical protein
MLEKSKDNVQNTKSTSQLATPPAGDKNKSYNGSFSYQLEAPQEADSRNSLNPVSRTQAECHSLFDTISSLPKVLFDLRRQRDNLYSDEPGSPVCDPHGVPCEILRQISTFCEVTQTCIGGINPTSDSHYWGGRSIFHLGLMIISTAVDIYGRLIQNDGALFASPLQLKSSNNPDGSSPRRHRRSLSTNSLWQPSGDPTILNIYFPPRLELVLYLTITDYHLTQFEWILSRLSNMVTGSIVPIYEGPSKELKKTQGRISQLRAEIRSSVVRLEELDKS